MWFRKEIDSYSDGKIFKSRFTRYPWSIEYEDDSLIARFGTYDELMQYARYMEDVRQQMVVDKLKGK